MHQIYKTEAFIFKKRDRGEADRSFSVFAKDFGRLEIFAKSIRAIASKLKAGTQLFSFSYIEFVQGKAKKTLTDANVLERYGTIAGIPEKMEVAYKVSDLLDIFIKGQESDGAIWLLVRDFFKKLDASQLSSGDYWLCYGYFFWNFVSVLGYKPQLFKCVHCGQALDQNHLYFSNKEGGIICQNCTPSNKNYKKINTDVIKILRLFLEQKWEMVLKLKIEATSLKLLQEVSKNYGSYLSDILVQ